MTEPQTPLIALAPAAHDAAGPSESHRSETAQPPARDRNEALDGVRALAALLVYFFHVGFNIVGPPFVILGFTGVHIFFVLSGYLMFGPFLTGLLGDRPFPSARRYAIRRFTRIYPPYLVALVFFSASRYALHLKPPNAFNFATHVLLIFNYFDWRDFFSINAVFWSLAIEAQFYVVLPLAVGMASNACGRRGWLSVVSVIAGFYLVGTLARGLEYSQAVAESGPRRDTYFMTIFAYLDLFAAGMMVAVADRLASDRLRRSVTLRWILVTLGAALFLGANLWSWMAAPHGWQGGHGLGYTVGFPVVLCAGVALLLTAVVAWPDGGPAFLHARPLVAIGLISYSLYLYHVGVQIVLRKVWPPGSLPGGQFEPLVFGLLALPATLVLSALLFALVERPAMRWGARYSRLHTPPPISF